MEIGQDGHALNKAPLKLNHPVHEQLGVGEQPQVNQRCLYMAMAQPQRNGVNRDATA